MLDYYRRAITVYVNKRVSCWMAPKKEFRDIAGQHGWVQIRVDGYYVQGGSLSWHSVTRVSWSQSILRGPQIIYLG
jgi:hypothetical protein